jgi:AraC-like DNA-binding protein
MTEELARPARVRRDDGTNFAAYAVRVLRASLRGRVHVRDCLAAAQLPLPADAESEDDEVLLAALGRGFLTRRQCARLLAGIKEVLNDEFYGLGSQPCRRGTFALASELALRSDTLAGAIDILFRFYGLVAEGVQFEQVAQGDDIELRVVLRCGGRDPDGLLGEHWLVSLHLLLGWMAGYLFPLKRVDVIQDAAGSRTGLARFLGGEHRFGQARHALVFSRAYLSLPVIRTQAELRLHLESLALGVPQWPGGTLAWSARVRAVLARSMQQRAPWPTQGTVALQLGVTSQSLRRHLRNEGTLYQTVCDALRRDLAIEKLSLQRLSVADVAEQLGYAEPRSFSRAFKQWTRLAPGAYQRRVHG